MKVNNKYQMSDYQCLLGSWTMILEKLLREKHGMEEKAARELAILNRDLLLNLSDGVVTFQYEKEDGTICVARGTLRRGISEAFDEWTLGAGGNQQGGWPWDYFIYWNLDEEDFRWYNVAKLIKIERNEEM